jgi:hypothetical protein
VRSRVAHATMPGMAEVAEQPALLQIELERGSDPIRGTIGPPDGPAVPFTGWLELATALERALDGP